jgi:hypothetical protein
LLHVQRHFDNSFSMIGAWHRQTPDDHILPCRQTRGDMLNPMDYRLKKPKKASR